MKKLNNLAFIFVIFVAVTQSASAAVVHWTLNNWSLTGGGTVTGSFDYDFDFNAFSNVSISSTSGPESFTFVGLGADNNTLEFVTGDPAGNLLFGTSVVLAQIGGGGMTNTPGGPLSVLTSGGTNPLSSQALCGNANCTNSSDPDFLTAGNITGVVSAVPVPAAAWLFGTALVGFIGMSRRRKVA